MKNYQGESSEEIAIERWENEGGEVEKLPEMRINDNKSLIYVVCFAVLPFIYWLCESRVEI